MILYVPKPGSPAAFKVSVSTLIIMLGAVCDTPSKNRCKLAVEINHQEVE